MDMPSSSGRPPPGDCVRPSKRARSDTPSSSTLTPSGRISVSYIEDVTDLKRQLADALKEIDQLKETRQHLKKIKEHSEKMYESELKAREEANERIKGLQQELAAAKEEISELKRREEQLLVTEESRIQALLMKQEYTGNNEMHGNSGEPSTSSQSEEDNADIKESIKTEPELIIPEDPRFGNVASSSREPQVGNIQHSEATSTTLVPDSDISGGDRGILDVNRAQSIPQTVSTSSEFDEDDREVQRYGEPQQEVINEENASTVVSKAQRESNTANIEVNEAEATTSRGTADAVIRSKSRASEAKRRPLEVIVQQLSLNNGSQSASRVATENQEQASTTQEVVNERNNQSFVEINREILELSSANHEEQSRGDTSSAALDQGVSRSQAVVEGGSKPRVRRLIIRKKFDAWEPADSGNNQHQHQHTPVAGPSGSSSKPRAGEASSRRAPNMSLSSDRRDRSTEAQQLIRVNTGHWYTYLVSKQFFKVKWGEQYIRKNNKWECKTCHQVFPARARLVEHVWCKHEKGKFYCPHCPNNSKGLSHRIFSLHVKSLHPELFRTNAFRDSIDESQSQSLEDHKREWILLQRRNQLDSDDWFL